MTQGNGSKNTGTALAQKAQATQNTAIAKKETTVFDIIQSDSFKKQIALVLPKHVTPDKLSRTAVFAIKSNPGIKDCTKESLLSAIMEAACLGVNPNPKLGHMYLLPFDNRKKGVKECQFILGYKGMIDMIYRSGQVESMNVEIIRENDEYEVSYGTDRVLKHKINFNMTKAQRGKPIAAYITVQFKNSNSIFFHIMSISEIFERKARSKSANSKYTPWVTDEDAMIKKTVVRDALRWLPFNTEFMTMLSKDESVAHKLPETKEEMDEGYHLYYPDAIDAEFDEISSRSMFEDSFQKCFGEKSEKEILKFAIQELSGKEIKSLSDITDDNYQTLLAAVEKFKTPTFEDDI